MIYSRDRHAHLAPTRAAVLATWATLSTFAVVGLTAGCTKDGGSGFELQGHKASEFPGVDEPPVVLLQDAGDGDKAPLRYKFTAGTEFPLQLTMRMKMAITVGDNALPSVPLPGMKMNARMSVTAVEDGKARTEFVYEGRPELVDGWDGEDPADNPIVASQLQRSLAGLDGMRGHAEITDRGFTLNSNVELGPNPDPQLTQMIQSMRQALNQMAAPWPDEPVGVGARWHVLQHMKLNGIEMYQLGAYRLEQRDGDRVALAVEIWQSAPKQTFQPPGVPAGTTAKIREFTSTGKGSMKVQLGAPVPESNVAIDNRMKMQIEGAGQSQEMSMTMSMRMEFGSN